ncbi:MAG: HAD hydrolase family protein [Microscillaceae bacterium]|nr:HAD hydrolase family protein [Microscillaceae bacterium]
MEIFRNIGAEFIISPQELATKLNFIKAFVFDWDGVWNNGIKSPETSSPYAEPDSMGTNLLRYECWSRSQEMPIMAIITGADNPTAIQLAEREHFQAVYSRTRDKKQAIQHLCEHFNIHPIQVACVFDDVNDLAMAKICGLRFQVRRKASPLLMYYTKRNQLCDYITGNEGGTYAIREICEMLMELNDNYDQVIEDRVEFSAAYQKYFAERKAIRPSYFITVNQSIQAQEIPEI